MKTFFSNNFDVQIQLSSSFYWISLQLLMNLLQCADNSTAEWGRSFMFLSHLPLFSPQKRSFNVREISLLLWDYDGYHKLNLLVKVFRRKEEGWTWRELLQGWMLDNESKSMRQIRATRALLRASAVAWIWEIYVYFLCYCVKSKKSWKSS